MPATKAVRRALATATVAPRGDTRDAHLATELAATTDWTQDDLLTALRIAAGLPHDPVFPGTPGRIDGLLRLTGIDQLALVVDGLLDRVRAGTLTDAERAALPVEPLDLLVRA